MSANVPVVRTRWRPGRYSDLLPFFFPCLENTAGADPRPNAPPACGEGGKEYTKVITNFSLDTPAIRTAPERDPGEVFAIDYKSKWFQWFVDRKFGIDLTEDGVPSKVSAEANDRTGRGDRPGAEIRRRRVCEGGGVAAADLRGFADETSAGEREAADGTRVRETALL